MKDQDSVKVIIVIAAVPFLIHLSLWILRKALPHYNDTVEGGLKDYQKEQNGEK